MLEGTYTNAGASTWEGTTTNVLEAIGQLKEKMEAIRGREPCVDVLVMLREDADKLRASIPAIPGCDTLQRDVLGDIAYFVVATVEDGRLLTIELQGNGKRVGLVGRLKVGDVADVPVTADGH